MIQCVLCFHFIFYQTLDLVKTKTQYSSFNGASSSNLIFGSQSMVQSSPSSTHHNLKKKKKRKLTTYFILQVLYVANHSNLNQIIKKQSPSTLLYKKD